ncbi:MAG: glycosyltransferase [Candidatus Latescibacteria bacterium]|nr:glycosyltransferase [bacterium]MBD3425542.1 glycosyltransferase [Candidatus Latescibacterota bacterium]
MENLLIVLIAALLGMVFYTYAGYPIILYIAGMFRSRKNAPEDNELPSVALIISAHNESRVIRDKIENSLQLDYPADRLKIIVASDGSDDGTNSMVREYPGVVLKAFDNRSGKSATLNRAVVGLEDDLLIFSDANAFYRKDAVRKLVRNFSDPEIGCVVGKLVYVDGESSVGKGESLYWKYEAFLNWLESRRKSVLVATGTIFAIRRELYRPVQSDVANDLQIPADIASQGYGVVYESEAVASEKATSYYREEFMRKYRIIVRGLTGYRHLGGDFGSVFRNFQFISRKLLRWWVGPALTLVYIFNIFLLGRPLFTTLFALQSIFYILALAGLVTGRGNRQSKFLYIPFYFVTVNAASFYAIATFLSGKRYSAWDKAETTRDFGEDQGERPELRLVGSGDEKPAAEKKRKQGKVERIT